MKARFFEDFAVGDRLKSQAVTLTESMIVDYAAFYDPQPIHMDKAGAEAGYFGGLIASGWQVGAIAFRMVVQAGWLYGGAIASPGIDKVRWLAPVRPGDTIHTEVEVTGARPSSKGGRGILELAYEVKNQKGEIVMTWQGIQIMATRPAEQGES